MRASVIVRRGRALALALGLCLAGAAPSAASAAASGARLKPPRSSDLRRATPGAGVSALEDLGTPTRLRGGATEVFPHHRVVSLYGAPQMRATALGRLSTAQAARRVAAEAARYRVPGARPVVPAFELVVSIATGDRGADGMYRFRQSDATIAAYLRAARRAHARLVLDIQPGRSPFSAEVSYLRRWLNEPDVDVALDPEWNVGRFGIPGRTQGSVDGATVDRVAVQLANVVHRRQLSQKVLLLHQFRRASITGESAIRRRHEVAPTLNYDGIGSRSAKVAGYRALAYPGLFHGFTLFYRLDSGLMSPSSVFGLRPRTNYVLYQ